MNADKQQLCYRRLSAFIGGQIESFCAHLIAQARDFRAHLRHRKRSVTALQNAEDLGLDLRPRIWRSSGPIGQSLN